MSIFKEVEQKINKDLGVEGKEAELTKKLFKGIYSQLISNDYSDLSDEKVVDVAFRTITQFAVRQRVNVEDILNEHNK